MRRGVGLAAGAALGTRLACHRAGRDAVRRAGGRRRATFLPQAQAALAAFAARPGYVRGRIGRAADDPSAWVLTTEWDGVGAYRRSLSAYDVKVDAAPLLSRGRDEASAFEVLTPDARRRAARQPAGAPTPGTVGVGEASGP